jgi:hypothetical protein
VFEQKGPRAGSPGEDSKIRLGVLEETVFNTLIDFTVTWLLLQTQLGRSDAQDGPGSLVRGGGASNPKIWTRSGSFQLATKPRHSLVGRGGGSIRERRRLLRPLS